MKNKKALSEVVTTIIIITLVIVVGGVIWMIAGNFATENLGKAKSCYNLFEKIQINDDYTCYNSSAQIMQISLSRGEISLDYLTIAISLEESSTIFELEDIEVVVLGVTNYPDGSEGVGLPGNSSGKTYLVQNIIEKPIQIEIAPVVAGTRCSTIDETNTIVNCAD